jgi:hypothetical protein
MVAAWLLSSSLRVAAGLTRGRHQLEDGESGDVWRQIYALVVDS